MSLVGDNKGDSFFFFFFSSLLAALAACGHVEVPGPDIEPEPQQ